MERKNWTLLVINAAGFNGLSPVQLQKSLFLISKNLSSIVGSSFYNFEPYDYGPFDANVYADARLLVQEGLVRMNRVSGQNWVYYTITPEGAEAARRVESTISPEAAEYVHKVVAWVRQLSFVDLITAIYRAYPEYQVNSVFITR